MVLLFFLPLFATEINDIIQEYSLLTLCGVARYLKVAYFTVVMGTVIVGILMLILKNCTSTVWLKSKIKLSLTLSILSAMLFTISLQPYAAVFAFSLFIIKVVLLLRKKENLK